MKKDTAKYKISPKGKRKLAYPSKSNSKSSIKLPLVGKTVYIDVKEAKYVKQLQNDLKRLGATLEDFVSKDINYLITAQPCPKSKPAERYGDISPNPSPFSCEPSPSPSNPEERRVAAVTRGKALAEKARINTRKTTTLLDNAEKWGVKIVSLEAALKWIDKELKKLPKSIDNKALYEKKKFSKSRCISSYKTLKCPYLKIEAENFLYRPCHSEIEVWPRLNVDTARGSCPFDGVLMKGDDVCGEERGGLFAAQVDIPTDETPREKDVTDKNTTTFRHMKELQKTCNKSELDTFAGSTILTAGEIRRRRELKRKQERKRGYCECCHVKYDDLDKHVQEANHHYYVKDTSHYQYLDSLINSGPSTESFLKEYIKKTTEVKDDHLLNSNEQRSIMGRSPSYELRMSSTKREHLQRRCSPRKLFPMIDNSNHNTLSPNKHLNHHESLLGNITLHSHAIHQKRSPRKSQCEQNENLSPTSCKSDLNNSPVKKQDKLLTSFPPLQSKNVSSLQQVMEVATWKQEEVHQIQEEDANWKQSQAMQDKVISIFSTPVKQNPLDGNGDNIIENCSINSELCLSDPSSNLIYKTVFLSSAEHVLDQKAPDNKDEIEAECAGDSFLLACNVSSVESTIRCNNNMELAPNSSTEQIAANISDDGRYSNTVLYERTGDDSTFDQASKSGIDVLINYVRERAMHERSSDDFEVCISRVLMKECLDNHNSVSNKISVPFNEDKSNVDVIMCNNTDNDNIVNPIYSPKSDKTEKQNDVNGEKMFKSTVFENQSDGKQMVFSKTLAERIKERAFRKGSLNYNINVLSQKAIRLRSNSCSSRSDTSSKLSFAKKKDSQIKVSHKEVQLKANGKLEKRSSSESISSNCKLKSYSRTGARIASAKVVRKYRNRFQACAENNRKKSTYQYRNYTGYLADDEKDATPDTASHFHNRHRKKFWFYESEPYDNDERKTLKQVQNIPKELRMLRNYGTFKLSANGCKRARMKPSNEGDTSTNKNLFVECSHDINSKNTDPTDSNIKTCKTDRKTYGSRRKHTFWEYIVVDEDKFKTEDLKDLPRELQRLKVSTFLSENSNTDFGQRRRKNHNIVDNKTVESSKTTGDSTSCNNHEYPKQNTYVQKSESEIDSKKMYGKDSMLDVPCKMFRKLPVDNKKVKIYVNCVYENTHGETIQARRLHMKKHVFRNNELVSDDEMSSEMFRSLPKELQNLRSTWNNLASSNTESGRSPKRDAVTKTNHIYIGEISSQKGQSSNMDSCDIGKDGSESEQQCEQSVSNMYSNKGRVSSKCVIKSRFSDEVKSWTSLKYADSSPKGVLPKEIQNLKSPWNDLSVTENLNSRIHRNPIRPNYCELSESGESRTDEPFVTAKGKDSAHFTVSAADMGIRRSNRNKKKPSDFQLSVNDSSSDEYSISSTESKHAQVDCNRKNNDHSLLYNFKTIGNEGSDGSKSPTFLRSRNTSKGRKRRTSPVFKKSPLPKVASRNGMESIQNLKRDALDESHVSAVEISYINKNTDWNNKCRERRNSNIGDSFESSVSEKSSRCSRMQNICEMEQGSAIGISYKTPVKNVSLAEPRSGYSNTPREERRKKWKRTQLQEMENTSNSGNATKRQKVQRGVQYDMESDIVTLEKSPKVKATEYNLYISNTDHYANEQKESDGGIANERRKASINFALKWAPGVCKNTDGKYKKVKYDKSWKFLDQRSVSTLLSCDANRESCHGVINNDMGSNYQPSNLVFEDYSKNVINTEHKLANQDKHVDNIEKVVELESLLPAVLSSPGNRSESSWIDACESYIDQSIQQRPNSSLQKLNSSVFSRCTSPNRSVMDAGCSLNSPFKSPTLMTTPQKHRNIKYTLHVKENSDIEKVDEDIEFNFSSPQKHRLDFSPLKVVNGVVSTVNMGGVCE